MNLRTRLLAVLVAAVGLVPLAAAPAGASASAAVIVSTWNGTVIPGYDEVPSPHSWSWQTGTATTVGIINLSPSVLGTTACTANGSDVTGNLAAAVGSGTWACSVGSLAATSGSLIYIRVGVVMVVATTGNKDGAGVCLWLPGTTPEAETYSMTCLGGVASS
jgi:hypothetical protein